MEYLVEEQALEGQALEDSGAPAVRACVGRRKRNG
jgi:hypothetical protein